MTGPAPAPDWAPPTPVDGGRPPGHGLTRRQVLPVVVALACVLLAALVMRASEPPLDFDASRTSVGRPAPLYGGEVTVTAVRAGQRIGFDGRGEEQLGTEGMFVVLDVEVAADREKLTVGSYQLASGDYVYESYQSADILSAPPGYVTSGSIVFEVDPAHIDDLTATIGQTEILAGYRQQVLLSVGITAANAAQWRESAQNRVVVVPKYPETRPVR